MWICANLRRYGVYNTQVHECMLSHFSRVWLCTTLWTVAHQLHGILRTRILDWVAMPSSRGSSQLKDRTHVSCSYYTAGGFFTTEPPEKPSHHTDSPHVDPGYLSGQNTGVDSLSFLQGILSTQGSNSGLLHCRFFTSWATRESQPKYLLTRKLSNIYKVIFLLMKLLLQMAS